VFILVVSKLEMDIYDDGIEVIASEVLVINIEKNIFCRFGWGGGKHCSGR
jgi:hypothetical protein